MAPRCPTCKHQALPGNPAFPFCSARCKAIDLGRWLGEEYRIADTSLDEDEDGTTTMPQDTGSEDES